MAIVPIMTSAPAGTASESASILSRAEQAATALQSITLDARTPGRRIRGTSVRLFAPIDGEGLSSDADRAMNGKANSAYGVRQIMRRDSLERRNALLKGTPGSRQRRRWENDRLLSNPWAEPPLPSDWEVRPTYPIRSVPYYLAPLWDAAEFQRSVEAKLNAKRHGRNSVIAAGRTKGDSHITAAEEAASNIPKEVRAKLKKARAAKGLLKDLEEVVRKFVVGWNEKERRLREEGLEDVLISDAENDEDEVVFVGRNGMMHDSCGRNQHGEQEDGGIEREKLVFEGLAEDKGASFGRWLVHEIAAYYQLRSWSVTVDGEPKRRESYVGMGSREKRELMMGLGMDTALPRPLYAMV